MGTDSAVASASLSARNFAYLRRSYAESLYEFDSSTEVGATGKPVSGAASEATADIKQRMDPKLATSSNAAGAALVGSCYLSISGHCSRKRISSCRYSLEV